jgi:hypothetical protein
MIMSKETSDEVATKASEIMKDADEQIAENNDSLIKLQEFRSYCPFIIDALDNSNFLLKKAKSVAASALAQKEDEWQDIETAPKDDEYYGDEIILYDGKEVFFGHWYKGSWYRRDCSDLMICKPTKWQPMPQPPKEKQ